ncbi:MAG: HAD-IA family hydrolase [Caldilineaceae bacterium]
MITTLFFDFDGVLSPDKSGSLTTCRTLHRAVPTVPFEHLLACYHRHLVKSLVGELSHEDVWAEFCACVGGTIEFNLLEQAFRAIPKNGAMFQLCARLKPHYKLGIITDNSQERFDVAKEALGLPALFDYIIVSGETGVRKDRADNFQLALALAEAKPAECIFIDNDPANLIAPAALGFHTLFHDDAHNDVDQLMQHLISLDVELD